MGRKKDELPTGQAREWLETGGLSSQGRRRAITSQMASFGRGAMIISFSLV